MLAAIPAASADDASPPEATASVVGTESAKHAEFRNVSASTQNKLAADVAEDSADMGVLVDDSAVTVKKAQGVGYIAGTDRSLATVFAVSVTESEVTSGDDVIGKDLEYGLVTAPPSDASLGGSATDIEAAVDDTELPLGPGSMSIKFLNQAPCAFLYGDDTGNYIAACETVGYQDNGDGRHSYGVADDDGSRHYDWFTYHQWGTIHPSDSGLDWIITSGKKTSYITGATISAGDPGTTDYAPNASSCDGALTMGVDFVFNFEGSLCVDGTEIFHPDGYGSMGQKLNIGLVAPDNSKALNYRIAIRIKQGVKPDWYTVNKATFRKQFSTSTNSITGAS
jgi:hypothetical protein